MGCARCGRRRVDPVGGPSTWRRGVVAGEQVLVCPDCQVEGWTTGLDACAGCGSTMLVKQLGVVTCRACGRTGDPPAAAERTTTDLPPLDEALAAEVADALDRLLGRPPGSR